MNDNNEELDLKDILATIIKRKWLIAIATAVMILVGSVYSFVIIEPQYKSETTLWVNGSASVSDVAASITTDGINLATKLIATYGEIVKSRIVLEQVISRLDLDMTYQELLPKVSAGQQGNTDILKISVVDESPEQAALITNTITTVFIKEVTRILQVSNVETIDRAIPTFRTVNTSSILIIAIAAILGLMLGILAAFVLQAMDKTIKTQQDVEKQLGLPVIGIIPLFDIEKEQG